MFNNKVFGICRILQEKINELVDSYSHLYSMMIDTKERMEALERIIADMDKK